MRRRFGIFGRVVERIREGGSGITGRWLRNFGQVVPKLRAGGYETSGRCLRNVGHVDTQLRTGGLQIWRMGRRYSED